MLSAGIYRAKIYGGDIYTDSGDISGAGSGSGKKKCCGKTTLVKTGIKMNRGTMSRSGSKMSSGRMTRIGR